MENVITTIKDLLSDSRFEEVFTILNKLEQKPFKKGILILHAEYKRNENEMISGTLQRKDWTTYLNQLSDRIFSLLLNIEESEKNISYKEDVIKENVIQNKYLTNVPTYYLKNLIGRDKELELLAIKLRTQNKPVLVYSIGGIGKTSLIAAYSTKYANEYEHIAWVTLKYETDKAQESYLLQNLLNSELTSLKQFHVTPQNDSKKEALVLVNKLRNLSDGPNLLIIDNAIFHDFDLIQRYFGQMDKWHIVITSRHQPNLKGISTIKLDIFDEERAVNTFEHYLNRTLTQKETKKLKGLLFSVGYHTLVIELMAKSMNALHLTLNELINDFEQNGLNIYQPEQVKPEFYQKSMSTDTVLGYVSSLFNLEKLSKREIQILKWFCLMPSIFIPFKDLCQLLNIKPKELSLFRNGLSQLFAKGWLMREVRNSQDSHVSYKIHRIVQEVVMNKFHPEYPNDFQDLINGLCECLKYEEYSTDTLINNPSDKFKWLGYYDYLKNILPTELDFMIVKLNARVSAIMMDKALYLKCLNLNKSALSFYNNKLGINSIESNQVRLQLGLTYQFLGKFSESIKILEKALGIASRHRSSDKLHLTICGLWLARSLCSSSQLIESQKIFETELLTSLSFFTEFHPIVLDVYKEYANLLFFLGEYTKAKKFIDKCINGVEQVYGPNHTNNILTQHVLGRILSELGDFHKAKDIFFKIIKDVKHNYGDNYPALLIYLHDLGRVFYGLGELQKARELFEDVIEDATKNFRKDVPFLPTYCSDLGIVLKLMGEYKEAEIFLKKALNEEIKNHGTNHIYIPTHYKSLAFLYLVKGDWSNAQSHFIETLRIGKDILSPDHFSLSDAYRGMDLVDKILRLSKSKKAELKKELDKSPPEEREDFLFKEMDKKGS